MSVVIGTREFLAADKRLSDETGERYLPAPKVFRNRHMLAGAVGMYSALMQVRDLLRAGATSPIDLLPALDGYSEALCLQKGRLYLVGSTGVTRVPKAVYGIGTGADAALGYLAGCGDLSLPSVKKAIRFSFTRRSDCGDGIRSLSG